LDGSDGDSQNGETRLTRSQLLARGGLAGLALVAADGGRLLGGPGSAFAAGAEAAPARVRTFVSRRDLRPPVLTIRHPAHGAAEGHLFIAPSSGAGQRGVLIFDNTGEPVWFHPTTPVTATAFRASTLHGKPVLTWWEGTYSVEGLGRGVYVVADDSYREIARIRAGGHRDGDLHEFLLTPEGTALVTKNEAVTRDLTAYGGSSGGIVYGGVVQEIHVPSGRVLFEWRSLDHVGLDESHGAPHENRFDYFHVNSVDVDADGHLLVSARNTWAVYKVHRHTGEVLWRLGGRRTSFAMGKGTVTAWQHDARSHDGGKLISIFDNGAAPQVQTQSRIVLVRLDHERMRATLEKAFKHRPNRLVAKFMGNGQLLPDGGVVSGWGSEPFVTEFAPDGRIRFEAAMPRGGQNYRAFRFPWKGTPAVPPRLAAGTARGRRGLFVSWNGATEVASWQLRYGASAGSLADGAVAPRTGFETYMPRPPGTRFAQAIALDAKGRPIGRSRVQRV
jgi:hypothetical protein